MVYGLYEKGIYHKNTGKTILDGYALIDGYGEVTSHNIPELEFARDSKGTYEFTFDRSWFAFKGITITLEKNIATHFGYAVKDNNVRDPDAPFLQVITTDGYGVLQDPTSCGLWIQLMMDQSGA